MGTDSSKPIPFNEMSEDELDRVRRTSLSENNLHGQPRPRFRRTFSITRTRKQKVENRQPLPVTIPAHSLHDVTVQQLVNKWSRTTGWETYWCVLQDTTIYIYNSSTDDEAVDSIHLQDYSYIRRYASEYKGKEHVIELKHQSHDVEYIAMCTQDDLENWFNHLETAIKSQKPNRDVSVRTTSTDESNIDDRELSGIVNEYHNSSEGAASPVLSRELVQIKKQQLLHEVLQHKEKLQKQQSIQSKESENDSECVIRTPSPDVPLPHGTGTMFSVDQLSTKSRQVDHNQEWKELLRLKQRRTSIELKIESLQRALTSGQTKPQKPKMKTPFDLLRGKSRECVDIGYSGNLSEIDHWEKQLEDLSLQYRVIIGEIEERESRHSWYSDVISSRPVSVASDRSTYRDTECHSLQSDGEITQLISTQISGEKAENRFVSSQSTLKHSIGSSATGQVDPSSTTRLQKITKMLPNLPTLMVRKNQIKRSMSERPENGIRRASLDSGKPRENKILKRISIDERLVTNSRYNKIPKAPENDAVQEDQNEMLNPASSPTVPPNSLQSLTGSPTPDSRPLSPFAIPNAEILTSVMVELNKLSEERENQTEQYQDSRSDENYVQDTGQLEPEGNQFVIPPPDSFSDVPNSPESLVTSNFTIEIKNVHSPLSRQLSPMSTGSTTEDSLGSPHPSYAYNILDSPSTAESIESISLPSPRPQGINPEALANIAAFEQLICNKLGYLPRM